MDLSAGYWRGTPGQVEQDRVFITTSAGTDLWQRTYYGFRVANAPALLWSRPDNFTFSMHVDFTYQRRYDQAGVLVWVDDDNWFKAGIEYENGGLSRLGSVLTTGGYSDWATRDIAAVSAVGYRLSRRGPDFRLEAKVGPAWEQLRVFHVAALGETTAQMAGADPSAIPVSSVDVGVYAASPEQSSFTAVFSNLQWGSSTWAAHV